MSAIPTILSVTCPWCDAKPGAICVRPSGKVFRDIHKDRWDAFSFRRNLGTSRFVVEITTDDPEFALRAGEHYTASVYWLDPAAKLHYMTGTVSRCVISMHMRHNSCTGVPSMSQ